MFSITSEELKTTGYSLDVGEYLVEKSDNYDVSMVALSEVITKQNNFHDINADTDYKIIKMSKLVAPEIREIKKGCNIKSPKLQLVEESTFIMSKHYMYAFNLLSKYITCLLYKKRKRKKRIIALAFVTDNRHYWFMYHKNILFK